MRRFPLGTALLLALAAPVSAGPLDMLEGDDGRLDDGITWGLGAGGAGAAVGLGLLYYLGVGGLRHVDKENVLEHPLRHSLLLAVQNEPGVHLRELALRHGTAVTNTQWHLRKLEMAHLVRTQKVHGKRVYYPAQGGIEAKAKAVERSARNNPNADRLTGYLGAHGGANQRVLAEALQMNPGTVRWHLRKLEEAGVVRSIPDGAQTRYFLMKPAAGEADRVAAKTTARAPVEVMPGEGPFQ